MKWFSRKASSTAVQPERQQQSGQHNHVTDVQQFVNDELYHLVSRYFYPDSATGVVEDHQCFAEKNNRNCLFNAKLVAYYLSLLLCCWVGFAGETVLFAKGFSDPLGG
jgi:hypothetical protein